MSGPLLKHQGKPYHVTVVGGGITGLSAAWYLQQAQDEGSPLTYTLLEQSDRWGGKINTDHVVASDDTSFVVEGGPDSFITQKPWALRLARDLGMEDRFLSTNDDRRQTFVLNRGKPTPLPDGVMLMVPTKILPFAMSPLISSWGKLRMGMDLVIPPRTDDGDETLADFIKRRLGAEALDKIAEPLLSGIYNADAEKQSIMATFPRFRQIEKEHGSLIRGMLAARRSPSRTRRQSAEKQAPSIFLSFRDGMQELVDNLSTRLEGDCRLGVGVESISARRGHNGQRARKGYVLALSDGTQWQTDAVVLAVPAYRAARLLQALAPGTSRELQKIRYVSTGTISLAYQASEFHHPLDGFGVVIPRTERRSINALTWTSTKFDHRAPQKHVLMRAFFGGSRTPQMMDVADDELLATVRQEIAQIMGVRAAPLFHRTYRYFEANPQYDVGHLDRVSRIENSLPPAIYVTGSPYRGIGIPDCVHQAQQTVAAIVEQRVIEPLHTPS